MLQRVEGIPPWGNDTVIGATTGGGASCPRSAIEELSRRDQWVAWRSQSVPGKDKPTKIPINPRTGRKASVADARTWGSREDAEERARSDNLAGVGFVFTADDDVTGVDLDDCIGADGAIEGWAADILTLGETYAETSPSGRGIHLFARGKIGAAIKSNAAGVEIYDRGRYFTMTFQHISATPTEVRPATATLERLQARVEAFKRGSGAPEGGSPPRGSSEQRRNVETGETFFGLVNSRALENLARWVPAVFGTAAMYQKGTGAYRVSSRTLGRALQEDLSIAPNGIVDFGIADMGDRRNGKRSPIDVVIEHGSASDSSTAALWLCERLGVDPELLGWGEKRRASAGEGGALAAGIIAGRSSTEESRLVEAAGGDIIDNETGEVVASAVPDEASSRLTLFGPGEAVLDEGYLLPHGLVGDIARWILDTSRRPLGRLAVGAALTTVGTMIARAVYGPTESSVHLYIAGLARTGAGKDHPLRAGAALLREGGMEGRIGPGEFTSQSAVVSAIVRRPAMLAPLDELGSFLARVNAKMAGGWERGISKWLRTLWGTSLGDVQTPEWADRESQNIRRPALSIYGVSTPEQFYGALSEEDIQNGFINRFLLCSDARPPERDPPRLLSAGVPPSIVEGLARLRSLSEGIGGAISDDSRLEGSAPPKLLRWGVGAKQVYDLLRSRVEELEDRDAGHAALCARTPEIAVRIATIIAAGRFSDTVDVIDMVSGATLAVQSANAMAEGLRDAGDGSEHGERVRRVSEIIKSRESIKHRDLWRKLYRSMEERHFESVIRALVNAGEVEAEGFGTRGRGVAGAVYHWLGGQPGRARQVVTQVVTASAAA